MYNSQKLCDIVIKTVYSLLKVITQILKYIFDKMINDGSHIKHYI